MVPFAEMKERSLQRKYFIKMLAQQAYKLIAKLTFIQCHKSLFPQYTRQAFKAIRKVSS